MITTKENDVLFDWIHPNKNDAFLQMDKNDLKSILQKINQYDLSIRNQLGLDSSTTFGLEIEFERANMMAILKELQDKHLVLSWEIQPDLSLECGGEISSSILNDLEINWYQIKEVCMLIKKHAEVGKSTGSHVHIGVNLLGDKTESWARFFKIWSVYEPIIFRFCYGEYLTPRASLKDYATSVSNVCWHSYQTLEQSHYLDEWILFDLLESFGKESALNLSNVTDFGEIEENNTIEFRCPNGTLEPVIWQNNVNLFVHLIQYAKSLQYNDDIVQNRKNYNQKKFPKLYLDWQKNYQYIYLKQALEFSDLIFDNNLDKIYFLRQYLKSFDISEDIHQSIKAKSFVKKDSII